MSIRIDKEFESLIPPLSADEFKQLEENCVKDGIRDPLVVWPQEDGNEILIDGHNRWRIAAKHGGIPFERREMEFGNRDEAIVWICDNQLGRRNLPTIDKVILEDRKREILAEIAKNKRMSNLKQNATEDKKSCQRETQTRQTRRENSTDFKIAKAAGTSEDTVRKVRKINELASDRTKQLVREGKLSINQAFNSVHPKRPDPVKVAKEEHERFKADGNKIVDIQAAKVDQINQKIIDNALTQEVLKLLGTIERFGFDHKAEELKALQTELADDAKANMQGMIKNCHMILDGISNAINRR